MSCICCAGRYASATRLHSHRAGTRPRVEDDMADGAIQQDVRSVAPRRPAAPGMTIPRLTFAEQLVLWSARRLATAGHGAAATETDASACRQDVRARVGGELSVALYPTGGPQQESKRRRRWSERSTSLAARACAACGSTPCAAVSSATTSGSSCRSSRAARKATTGTRPPSSPGSFHRRGCEAQQPMAPRSQGRCSTPGSSCRSGSC